MDLDHDLRNNILNIIKYSFYSELTLKSIVKTTFLPLCTVRPLQHICLEVHGIIVVANAPPILHFPPLWLFRSWYIIELNIELLHLTRVVAFFVLVLPADITRSPVLCERHLIALVFRSSATSWIHYLSTCVRSVPLV